MANGMKGPPKKFRLPDFSRLAGPGFCAQLALVGLLTAVTVVLAFPAAVQYKAGDVADYTVRSDRALRVVDHRGTGERVRQAEAAVPPVYVLDDTQMAGLEDEAASLFRRGRELRGLPGAETGPQGGAAMDEGVAREMDALWAGFQRLFHLAPGSGLWPRLEKTAFRYTFEQQVIALCSEIMAMGLLGEDEAPAAEGRGGAIAVVATSSGREYTLPPSAALLDQTSLERFLDLRARTLSARFSPDETDLILTLARGLARPNLFFDGAETARRQAEARDGVETAYLDIRAGEVIAREGAVIGPEALEKIKALRETQTDYNWLAKFWGLFLVLFIFFNSGLILSMVNTGRRYYQNISLNDQIFICLLLVAAALMAHWANLFGASLSWDFDFLDSRTIFYASPTAAITMLSVVFMGVRRATYMALCAALVAALVSPSNKVTVFIYSYNGALSAIWCLRDIDARANVIPASFWVMATNCLTLLGLTLYADMQWTRQTAWDFCAAAASGLLSGVVASGLIPIIERVFGFTTNTKFLELGNLDSPLLRELMMGAPGTYHHSVIVGAMVEAAAEAIGANPHLAKVGAYYHDIGKMKKPLYFVENQAGENRHDTLAPSMSALILIGHVKEGAQLARENRLPAAIIDIIEQHHGTGLIAFFYHKAKEQRQEGQPEINEGDYRYPGPKPRRKEAGLVMLADICEAATRSLSSPTPAKIRGLVRQLVNNVWADGQMDACDLTAREIAVAEESFTSILIGIYHHRIAYPDGKKEAPHGPSVPLQPAKSPAD